MAVSRLLFLAALACGVSPLVALRLFKGAQQAMYQEVAVGNVSTGEYELVGKLTRPTLKGWQEKMLILKSGGGAVYTKSRFRNPNQRGKGRLTRYIGNWSEVLPGRQYSVTMEGGQKTVQVLTGLRSRYSSWMDLDFKAGPVGLTLGIYRPRLPWPIVVAVHPGSQAEQLGVKVGWRVMKVAPDGFSEAWSSTCLKRRCFESEAVLSWSLEAAVLVRFAFGELGVPDGYDEVRMGSNQLYKVSDPDAPAFYDAGLDD